MSRRRDALVILCCMSVALLVAGCDEKHAVPNTAISTTSPDVPDPSPAEMVQAIERVAGTVNVPKGLQNEALPYRLPVRPNAKPTKVGNYLVWPEKQDGSWVIVRPTKLGPQTFFYATKPPGGDAGYSFDFDMLPNTTLRTESNGSISVVDEKSGRSYLMLGTPWAKSADGSATYPTHFTTLQNSVVQWFDPNKVTYPLILDPPFDDPLMRLVESRVPELSGLLTTTKKDGPRHPMRDGEGYVYGGPNGIEMRYNHKGTVDAINWTLTVMGVLASEGGAAAEMGAAAGARLSGLSKATLGAASPKIDSLVGAAGKSAIVRYASSKVAGNVLSAEFDKYFGKVCLGVTLPRPGIDGFLRFLILATSFGNARPDAGTGSNMNVWFEPCSSSDNTSHHDDVNAPPPPGTNSNDTTLETPAQQIPTSSVSKHQESSGPPERSAGDYNMDMDKACQVEYGSNSARSLATDPNSKNSWICLSGSGAMLGPIDLDYYCSHVVARNSISVSLSDRADGWRCRTK